jgi:hypothetical protein
LKRATEAVTNSSKSQARILTYKSKAMDPNYRREAELRSINTKSIPIGQALGF